MPDLDHERQFNAPVIGIDEAGRGPWAGPVLVTAIWLCPFAYDTLPAGIDDSKKIKPSRRAVLAAALMAPPHLSHTVSIEVASSQRRLPRHSCQAASDTSWLPHAAPEERAKVA